MLGFVVPIKSPKVSKSWQAVSLLFERTARSICNQTNPNFRVIVVCDQKPNTEFSHPNLEYITVQNLPVPSTWVEKHGDKMHKVIRGIKRAKEFNCSHVMLVDSDDCVSNFLAEFISNNLESYGYVFSSGYRYQNNSQFLNLMRKGFHQYCGTSHIIRSDFYDFSDERLANLPSKITSLEQLPKDIHDLYYAHRYFAKAMDARGASLELLPFVGAVYIFGNTENISVNFNLRKQKNIPLKSRLLKLKASLFDNRRLSPKIQEEFGLYDLNLSD